jgi:hypothetical protein
MKEFKMTQHKQAEIYSLLKKKIILVDEGIADLIELLHKLGIATYLSCQENKPGTMWINFPSRDAEAFLTICASKREVDILYENSLYARMRDSKLMNNWQYDTHMYDWAEKFEKEEGKIYYEGDSDISCLISIRFPVSDYFLIMERLQSHFTSMVDSDAEDIPGDNS